jgi:hypothetical protein
MATKFVYGVLAVPWDTASKATYCNTGALTRNVPTWGQTQSSCTGSQAGILDNPSCTGYSATEAQFTCYPVSIANTGVCKSNQTNMIYPVLLSQGKIPLVNGGMNPAMMGALMLDSSNIVTNSYTAATDVATTGALSSPNIGCGAGIPWGLPSPNPTIILVYPISWITSWQDLDQFVPATLGGTSTFLNTGSQTYSYNGHSIPQLEDQLQYLLGNWCGSLSTTGCLNTSSNTCSNIFGKRNDNGINYCNAIYQAFKSNTYPNNLVAGVSQAIQNYCTPTNFPNSQLPPECLCAVPTASPYFAALAQAAQSADINVQNPYLPDSNFSGGSFGNVGCWWFPCQAPQTYLVPQDVQNAVGCPNVCSNIVDIINNGTINLSGTTITQTINCPSTKTCNPACTSSQTCVNGQCVAQTCSATIDCPKGQQCASDSCITPVRSVATVLPTNNAPMAPAFPTRIQNLLFGPAIGGSS